MSYSVVKINPFQIEPAPVKNCILVMATQDWQRETGTRNRIQFSLPFFAHPDAVNSRFSAQEWGTPWAAEAPLVLFVPSDTFWFPPTNIDVGFYTNVAVTEPLDETQAAQRAIVIPTPLATYLNDLTSLPFVIVPYVKVADTSTEGNQVSEFVGYP